MKGIPIVIQEGPGEVECTDDVTEMSMSDVCMDIVLMRRE